MKKIKHFHTTAAQEERPNYINQENEPTQIYLTYSVSKPRTTQQTIAIWKIKYKTK